MNKLNCIIFGSVLLLGCGANGAPKPNIVHIMVDDLGSQDIASHRIDGNSIYETPHMDRMTQQGRWFTQAYSPAPSCAPSRVAFLRGQHPVNTGVYHVSGGRIPRAWHKDSNRVCPYYIYGLPKDEPMIPEVLKKAGYVTAHIGKWHAGGKSAGYPFPLDQEFDFGFSENRGRTKYYNDSDLWKPEDEQQNQFFGAWRAASKDKRLSSFATDDPNDPYRLNEEDRPFDKPLELVLGFMDKHKDQPFFMNYCPYEVHGPIQTRDRKRFDHYVDKLGMEYPTDPMKTYYDLPGHSDPYYASMVDTVDYNVGQVITYLEQTDDPRNLGHKLIENTYLIVDSDNGGVNPYTDNAPLKGGKQNTWEGGVRIPFMVRGPGVEPGSICETPINLIDLFPTFITMAGLEQDPSLALDGCDILPLILGQEDRAVYAEGQERESLFWFFPWDAHMSAAIRKGDWKLVRHYGAYMGANMDADVQLFRLYKEGEQINDIGESKDVGDQFPEVRKALLAELDQKIAEAGAPIPHINPTGPKAAESGLSAMPAILKLGSDKDRVWVEMESGSEKAAMVDAQLVYTVNPKPFDTTNGNREEWMSAPASISKGLVEATMPPGATHAVFVVTDANGFLITSEPMPAVCDVGHHVKDHTLLKNGFAYKPGLYALIKLGQKAKASASIAGLDSSALQAALATGRAQYKAEPVQEKAMCDAIRSLRAEIRNLKETPEAAHPLMNRFPTDPLY